MCVIMKVCAVLNKVLNTQICAFKVSELKFADN